MKYDIIVPTFNLSEKTLKCFERIQRFTADFRLIWIDNGSDLAEFSAVEAYVVNNFKQHHIFQVEKNIGYVKATNIGLSYATAEWRVLLNNDVYVTSGWLDRMTLCADINGYDIVGPITSPNAMSYQGVVNMHKKVRDSIPLLYGYDTDAYADIIKKIMKDECIHIKHGMIAFFCTAIRSKVVERIGYLSEEFGIGFGDDDDFSERAHRNNFRLGLDLSTYVHHDHRSTFHSMFNDQTIKDMQTEALNKYKERKQNLK